MGVNNIEGSVHEEEFKEYKKKHGASTETYCSYRLSFFASWDYKKRDVCFMRLFPRFDEWEIMGKGSFLYFDDFLSYVDYEKLVADINFNYGKIIECNLYKDDAHVLFEFTEKVGISKQLAMCMYLSIFVILRCTGNEYKKDINISSIGKVKMETLLDGILLHSFCSKYKGHNINDGLNNLMNIFGKESIRVYSSYYMDIVKELFGINSSISLEKIEENIQKYFKSIAGVSYPGQTKMFGVLEEVYFAIRND